MTEERRRWREYYEQKWPAEIHGYEETEERIAFISQQRKEAAREALEAAAREVMNSTLTLEDIKDLVKQSGRASDTDFNIGGNAGMRRAVSIINKHIEDL